MPDRLHKCIKHVSRKGIKRGRQSDDLLIKRAPAKTLVIKIAQHQAIKLGNKLLHKRYKHNDA